MNMIDECDTATATNVVKSVNIMVALRWITLAWNKVRSETIIKCFMKAGVLDDTLEVITLDQADCSGDPFATIDQDAELQKLIEQTGGSNHGCTPQQFVSGDDDLLQFVWEWMTRTGR